mmetsp:Transcript_22141/g.59728  ORF Transcript_22141/g.59728 Transcript_22141/m.59728 type:complete len:237 (-) Transcript_22141:320-1030(-)
MHTAETWRGVTGASHAPPRLRSCSCASGWGASSDASCTVPRCLEPHQRHPRHLAPTPRRQTVPILIAHGEARHVHPRGHPPVWLAMLVSAIVARDVDLGARGPGISCEQGLCLEAGWRARQARARGVGLLRNCCGACGTAPRGCVKAWTGGRVVAGGGGSWPDARVAVCGPGSPGCGCPARGGRAAGTSSHASRPRTSDWHGPWWPKLRGTRWQPITTMPPPLTSDVEPYVYVHTI